MMTIAEFYNDFYDKAEKSQAHAMFCERVYGINLCQHGMADDEQIRLMLAELGLDHTSKVLDLGCGPGLISAYIQRKLNCRLVGLDISPLAIQRAVARFGSQNPNLQFFTGDMAAYDFQGELFDAILLIDTHYFIDDFTALIPTLLDRLTENGKMAIFSDEGQGIDGLDESNMQLHETIIGRYLTAHQVPFKGIRLYAENQAHWLKKKQVLLELKDEFEKENNQSIYDNRLSECTDHDRSFDGRYLYIVSKPQGLCEGRGCDKISPMSASLVKDFYTEQVRQEWRRLQKDAYRRLEFETTLHFLAQYLPPHGLILDAGGGPGRYTLELARRGYQVTLLDYTPANLDFARRRIRRAGLQRQVTEVVEGSIVDLSRFADNTFDAVLCSGGPLSHVVDGGQRARAIAELTRVAKKGAPLFVSVMGRLGVLVTILNIGPEEVAMPHYRALRDTGDYHGQHGFTACHFFLPEELRQAFTRPDLHILEMAGLEGISSHHRKTLNRLARQPALWQIWRETHFQTCTHPSVVGLSEHMLIVCRKTG